MTRDETDDEERGLDEGVFDPPDRPTGVEDWGTTAEEQLAGEPLSERLREEEPDVAAHPRASVGRMEDDGEVDETPELVGELAPGDDRDLSAEEAAMTSREDAPGATSHPDDYTSDEAPPDETPA
jgi:hypothetical protein